MKTLNPANPTNSGAASIENTLKFEDIEVYLKDLSWKESGAGMFTTTIGDTNKYADKKVISATVISWSNIKPSMTILTWFDLYGQCLSLMSPTNDLNSASFLKIRVTYI